MNMKKYIEVTVNRRKERINAGDILYAESFGRNCYIYTTGGSIRTFLRIDELIGMLDPGLFLRCHRSYIVNMRRVKEKTADMFVLENKVHVPVSRRMIPATSKAYSEFKEREALFVREILIYLSPPLPTVEGAADIRAFVAGLNTRYARRGFRFFLYISGEGERLDDIEAEKSGDIKLDTTQYANPDALKLAVALRLKPFGLDEAENNFEGINTENIPAVSNSKNYAAMKETLAELEEQYLSLREKIRKNPDDEEALTLYLDISGQKNKLNGEIQTLKRDIISLEASFLERSDFSSLRVKETRELFETGDLESAKRHLDLDEMSREDEAFDNWVADTRKKIAAKVNDYLYLADMLKTDVANPHRFAAIERTYEQAAMLEEKHIPIGRAAIRKYADYLYYQKDYEKAAETAARQLGQIAEGNEAEIADYCHFISRCYNRLHRYEEAEKLSRRALEIRERLAALNQNHEPDVAKTLDGLARLIGITGDQEEAVHLYERASAIYERLADGNPAFLPDLAKNYNNLSEQYLDLQRYTDTETLCVKALAIHEQLAAENPARYNTDLARSYTELAYVYNITRRYAEAETLHTKAIDIRQRLAAENPAAFEPDLAFSFVHLARVYENTQEKEKEMPLLQKALLIYERLYAVQPAVYEHPVAFTSNNLAKAYVASGDYAGAEKLYAKALRIVENPAEGDPVQAFIAILSYNLAICLEKAGRYEKSEALHKKSLKIYEDFMPEKQATFEPDLAKGYNGYATLLIKTERRAEAEIYVNKAIEILERLVINNPAVFQPILDKSRETLASLHFV
jgi:tetratricopeptide (TPR) repeat protein